MNDEPASHDARQLRRMLECIVAARGERISLVDAANSLLFLRDALEVAGDEWSSAFTSHAATLESAGLATPEQKVSMGSRFEDVISTALAELESLVRAHSAAIDVE